MVRGENMNFKVAVFCKNILIESKNAFYINDV